MLNHQKGIVYEHAVRAFMLRHRGARRAYLWHDVPIPVLHHIGLVGDWNMGHVAKVLQRQRQRQRYTANPLPDTGVDLVVQHADYTWDVVQAKAYRTRKVRQADLAGFWAHMMKIGWRMPDVYGTIVHTSGVTSTVQSLIDESDGRLREICLPFDPTLPFPSLSMDEDHSPRG